MPKTIIPNLPQAVYDWLKDAVAIYIPAFATFYLTLGQIWGLPGGNSVVATATAVTTFLGLVLKVNSARHQAEVEAVENARSDALADAVVGGIQISADGQYHLHLDKAVEEFNTGDFVLFSVMDAD